MGFSTTLNRNRRKTTPDDVQTDALTYKHVRDLKKKDFPVFIKGFFISNKSKYGQSVALIGEDIEGGYIGLNIPSWYIDRFKGATDEEIQQMLDGKLLLTEVKALETSNGKSYELIFEDVE